MCAMLIYHTTMVHWLLGCERGIVQAVPVTQWKAKDGALFCGVKIIVYIKKNK